MARIEMLELLRRRNPLEERMVKPTLLWVEPFQKKERLMEEGITKWLEVKGPPTLKPLNGESLIGKPFPLLIGKVFPQEGKGT